MASTEVTDSIDALWAPRLADPPEETTEAGPRRGRYLAAVVAADGAGMAAAVLAGNALAGDAGGHRLAVASILAAAWVVSIAASGAYARRPGAGDRIRVVTGAARFTAAVCVVAVGLGLSVNPGVASTTVVVATVFTLAVHELAAALLGAAFHRVLLVGSEERVVDLVRSLQRHGTGIRVVGACVTGRRPGTSLVVDFHPVPVLDAADALDPRRLSTLDSVVVADHDANGATCLRDVLKGTGVDVLLAPPTADLGVRRLSPSLLGGVPLVRATGDDRSGPWAPAMAWAERVLAGLLLLAVLPLLVGAALVIRCTSRGGALFSQVRLGQGGRPFTIWKLRTMGVDAEAERAGILHLNEHDGLVFKVRRDPRITPIGRLLRRYSIDELPQLWNVVRGDMRLVGPRPPLPDEVALYDPIVSRRLLVKPGLTGLWQVSGRADLAWVEGIDLDLRYVDTRTGAGDLAILCRTVRAVLGGKGAY
ncbi:MAG TPA: exopolysaccharide biosynthesis polyprenyl glycosylphosphotransferase [Dermatophilaceae bacterium]|nr:exopolysaccharide biosynthesis polyprenyl glycosylphosphotransferase [Dermatophilaceae bacterium]